MKRQAKLFRRLRERQGYTQRGFGEALQVHGQFVSNIERGKANIPIKIAMRLSKMTATDPSVFMHAWLDDMADTWERKYEWARKRSK